MRRSGGLKVCGWLALLVLAMATGVCAQQKSPPNTWQFTVPPDHPQLQYVGRWDFSDPKAPTAGWQGSSVRLRFQGTDLSIRLDSGSSQEYFRVIVDGDTFGSRKFPASPGAATYSLVTGLGPGLHTVEVVKETYFSDEATVLGFSSTGFRLVPPPDRPARKIEFYGDSNLAGYSLEHEENNGSSALVGATFTYAGVAARRLGAEFHNVSISGGTISSMHGVYDRIFSNRPNPAWDFARFPADVVVVNLGANDIWRSKQKIKTHYHAFLDDLRTQHPTAHIMLFNAFGWSFKEPANYIHEVIAERNDPQMSSQIFPWVFERWHGCEYDHAGMAAVLVDHLESVLGWDSSPGDVVSGYGLGGDVANGSFEEAAPFGGYCWRYMNQSGVERIRDPAGASAGEWFVRLSQADPIHQPVPASGGDTFTVTVWLRATVDGKRADLTVDFRDQEMYTSPLQSDTERKTLSTAWQQYSISATAPTGGSRPVFHTRLTITPVGNASVDVDDVSMSKQ